MRFGLNHAVPLAAGCAIGWSGLHPAWAPLQIPAFIALALSLMTAAGFGSRLRTGSYFGAGMSGLVLMNIRIPPLAEAILFLGMASWWALLGWGLSTMLQQRTLRGAFAAAGLVVLGEWAQSSIMPLFGTAQRFASAWVDYSFMLPLSKFGGTALIALFLCMGSFTLAQAVFASGRGRFKQLSTVGVLVLVLAALNYAFENKGTDRTIRVATIGARDSSLALKRPEDFWRIYGPYIEQAAVAGASLVVTPELGLSLTESESESALTRLAGEAKRLNVTLAVGFAQTKPLLNRGVLLNTGDALVSAVYDKTHWVPMVEQYDRRGDGTVVVGTTVDGTKIGLMICQDDNFEEVSRRLSLAGVQIAVVPTLDWRTVEWVHLNNARNRPREFGFVEARAAIGGISALIDSSGRLAVSRNHLVEGDGIVVGEVPIPASSPTFFARFGNMPTLILSGLSFCFGLWGSFQDTRSRSLSYRPRICS